MAWSESYFLQDSHDRFSGAPHRFPFHTGCSEQVVIAHRKHHGLKVVITNQEMFWKNMPPTPTHCSYRGFAHPDSTARMPSSSVRLKEAVKRCVKHRSKNEMFSTHSRNQDDCMSGYASTHRTASSNPMYPTSSTRTPASVTANGAQLVLPALFGIAGAKSLNVNRCALAIGIRAFL
jgi:hypothetical protein